MSDFGTHILELKDVRNGFDVLYILDFKTPALQVLKAKNLLASSSAPRLPLGGVSGENRHFLNPSMSTTVIYHNIHVDD